MCVSVAVFRGAMPNVSGCSRKVFGAGCVPGEVTLALWGQGSGARLWRSEAYVLLTLINEGFDDDRYDSRRVWRVLVWCCESAVASLAEWRERLRGRDSVAMSRDRAT